jgi:hypothetical protein
MFIFYYFLAKDEERRMVSQFGDAYSRYMKRTGMFLPRLIETLFSFPFRFIQHNSLKYVAVTLIIPMVVIGCGFLLREITLHSLLFEANGNVTLVSILPEDDSLSQTVLSEIFSPDSSRKPFLIEGDKDYLGYLMPADYVMQGMIANTGDEFHLHKQHHTFTLIIDWVLNPFEHLRRSPSEQMARMHHIDPAMIRRHHCPLAINDPALQCQTCPFRRVIFVEIDHKDKGHLSKERLFSFGSKRVPVCLIDINVLTGEIINMKRVERATAWRDVPTPAI